MFYWSKYTEFVSQLIVVYAPNGTIVVFVAESTNEYEPLPKDFHGPPDYLDEMRIDDIEELEGEFEVYHIIEAESATMMFANNTILHVGINWKKLNLVGIIGIIQDNPKSEKLSKKILEDSLLIILGKTTQTHFHYLIQTINQQTLGTILLIFYKDIYHQEIN